MCVSAKIMILKKDGSISKINCYNDGYLAGLGIMLDRQFQSERKVHRLINSGDISSVNINKDGERSFSYDTTRHQTKELINFNKLSDLQPAECNYLYIPDRGKGNRWLYCNSDASKYENSREYFYTGSIHSKFSYEYLRLLIAKIKMNHRNCLRYKSVWQSVQRLLAPY